MLKNANKTNFKISKNINEGDGMKYIYTIFNHWLMGYSHDFRIFLLDIIYCAVAIIIFILLRKHKHVFLILPYIILLTIPYFIVSAAVYSNNPEMIKFISRPAMKRITDPVKITVMYLFKHRIQLTTVILTVAFVIFLSLYILTLERRRIKFAVISGIIDILWLVDQYIKSPVILKKLLIKIGIFFGMMIICLMVYHFISKYNYQNKFKFLKK